MYFKFATFAKQNEQMIINDLLVMQQGDDTFEDFGCHVASSDSLFFIV